MTNPKPVARAKVSLLLAAALAGGSVLTTCQTRVRDAVVGGSRSYVFSLLDPSVFVGLLDDQTNDSPGT